MMYYRALNSSTSLTRGVLAAHTFRVYPIFHAYRPPEDCPNMRVLPVLSVCVFWRGEAGQLALRV
jgi:hypothetical protein